MSGKDYEVGYKKPPKGSQWQPGQSGNPSGGKSKKPPLLPLINEMAAQFNEMVSVKDGEKSISVPFAKAFSMKLIRELMNAPLKDKFSGLEKLEKLGVLRIQDNLIDELASDQPLLTEEDRQLLEMVRAEMGDWDGDKDEEADESGE